MYDPYADFETIVLPNGLTVHSLHIPNRPQSISFIIHSGGKHDPDGKEGLAHFTEHMMSANLPSGYLPAKDFFASYGGSVNFGTTNFNATWYKFYLPSEASIIVQGLSIMGTMLLDTTLEKGLESERKIIIGEYRKDVKIEKIAELEMRRRKLLYAGHWYARCKTPLGTLDSISALTLKDIQSFHREHYVPANMRIVSVGGMKTQDLIDLLSHTAFSNERSGVRSSKPVQAIPFVALEIPSESVDLSSIMKGMTSPIFESYGKIPLSVPIKALTVFWRMINEVLNEEVREKRGWTYSIQSGWMKLDSFYEYGIKCPSFSSGAQDEIAAVVSSCIQGVQSDHALFEKVKRNILASFAMEDLTASKIEGTATTELIDRDRILTNQDDYDEYESVKIEDILAISKALDEPFRHTHILHP